MKWKFQFLTSKENKRKSETSKRRESEKNTRSWACIFVMRPRENVVFEIQTTSNKTMSFQRICSIFWRFFILIIVKVGNVIDIIKPMNGNANERSKWPMEGLWLEQLSNPSTGWIMYSRKAQHFVGSRAMTAKNGAKKLYAIYIPKDHQVTTMTIGWSIECVACIKSHSHSPRLILN